MKNKQFAIGLTVGIVAMMCIAAAEYDLNKGIDLSSKTSVTTSQLNQLVDNGTVATNKGMLIYGTSTPDTTNNTRYSRFLWLDASANPPTVKVYNTNTAVWTNITATATIADNSVTAGKLATSAVNTTNITDGAVTTPKLPDSAITSAKINLGAVSNVHVAGYTLQSTNIATNGIASFNITAGAITGDKIANGSLSNVHFSASSVYGTNIVNGTITSVNIAASGVVASNLAASSAAFYVLRNNAAGSALEWALPGLLQTMSTARTDVVTCATDIPHDNSIPQNTEGDEVITLTITPKTTSSKLIINFTCYVGANNNDNVAAALFQDSTANALAATTTYIASSAAGSTMNLKHVMSPGTTSATTFKVRVGASNAAVTAYVNGLNGTRQFGGVDQATLSIQEVY